MGLSEHSEQAGLCRHLDRCSVFYCAIPNGGLRDGRTAKALTNTGLKKGMPDLLVFDRPPKDPEKVGVAIEMKKVGGRGPTPHQQRALARLQGRGWEVFVAYGCSDALKRLRELGYNV